MPLAKVHLLEGQYNSARIAQLSKAIQDVLIEVLGIPPDDFFQIHSRASSDPFRVAQTRSARTRYMGSLRKPAAE